MLLQEDFAHFIQSHDDSILCGFNARNSRECRSLLDLERIQKMKKLFELALQDKTDEKKHEYV